MTKGVCQCNHSNSIQFLILNHKTKRFSISLINQFQYLFTIPAYWEDNPDNAPVRITVTETEGFESGGDDSTDVQREIYTFRARDPDKETNFEFDYKYEKIITF